MYEFIALVSSILPLYAIVGAGYVAGKYLKVDRNSIAPLLIYIISPAVVFYGIATAPVNNSYLLLPVIFYVVGLVLSFSFYQIGKIFWKGNEKNLLSATAGTGNSGYFGLPLVLAVAGEKALSVATFCLVGFILYEATRNYYIIAKGQATAKEAAVKALKMPIVYAFTLGLIANRLGISIDGGLLQTFTYFKGAYVVFGMMIIGIVLASVSRAHFDVKFTALAFAAKFIAYPALIGLTVLLDGMYWHLFTAEIHAVMMILSVVPMASNIISYATLLKTHPEKVTLSVMASTLFALVYIPIFIAIFLK